MPDPAPRYAGSRHDLLTHSFDESAAIVRAMRVDAGMTRKELSGASGLAVSQISKIERGTERLSRATYARLFRAVWGCAPW